MSSSGEPVETPAEKALRICAENSSILIEMRNELKQINIQNQKTTENSNKQWNEIKTLKTAICVKELGATAKSGIGSSLSEQKELTSSKQNKKDTFLQYYNDIFSESPEKPTKHTETPKITGLRATSSAIPIKTTDEKIAALPANTYGPYLTIQQLQELQNTNEDNKRFKLNIKEYQKDQYIQEWVANVTPIVVNSTTDQQKQKAYLTNSLPSDMHNQVYQECLDIQISYEEFCKYLYQKFGTPVSTLLSEFLQSQLKPEDDIKDWCEVMIKKGKAAQLNEQAIICQIRCRLPEYLSRYLQPQYLGLFEFKGAVSSALIDPTVELFREFKNSKSSESEAPSSQQNKQNYNYGNSYNNKYDNNKQYKNYNNNNNGGYKGNNYNKDYKSNYNQNQNQKQYRNNNSGSAKNDVQNNGSASSQNQQNQAEQQQPETKANISYNQDDDFQQQKQQELVNEYVEGLNKNFGQNSNNEGYVQGSLCTVEVEQTTSTSGAYNGVIEQNQEKVSETEQTITDKALQALTGLIQDPNIENINAFVETLKKRKVETEPVVENEASTQTSAQHILNRALQNKGNVGANEKKILQNILGLIKNEQQTSKKQSQIVLDSEAIYNNNKQFELDRLLDYIVIPISVLNLLKILINPNAGQLLNQLFTQLMGSIQGQAPFAPLQIPNQQATSGNTGTNQQGTSSQGQNPQQNAKNAPQGKLSEIFAQYGGDIFAKLPIQEANYLIDQYKKQIAEPKAGLFLAKIHVGDACKEGTGVVDTGCTATLMPLNKTEKFNLINKVVKLQAEQQITVNGIGGKSKIIGVLPKLTIYFEQAPVVQSIGVIESGEFDMLIGNDITESLQMKVDICMREASYSHPMMGQKIIKFGSSKKINELSASLAITGTTQESELMSQAAQQQFIKTSNQRMVNSLKKTLPAYMVDMFQVQFQEYISGQSLLPSQVRAIQDFSLQDFVSQEVRREQLYPYLQDVIYKNEPSYDLIIVDPAWKFIPMHKSIPPYKMQSFEELLYLPVQQLRAKDSIILLWTTGSHLFQAINLLNLWKYKYINILVVWRKIKPDGETTGRTMGVYARINCEYLLLGTFGKTHKFRSDNRHVHQYVETYQINEVPTAHSVKPEETYEVIKQIFKLDQMNVLELFARQRTASNSKFDIYGNQLTPHFQMASNREQGSEWVEYKTQPDDDPELNNLCTNAKFSFTQEQRELLPKLSKALAHLPTKQGSKILDALMKIQDVFKVKDVKIDSPSNIKFVLKKGVKPVQKKNKIFNKKIEEFLTKEIARLLKLKVISPSNSLYNVTPTIVEKSNGDYRLTLNLIPVNEQFELTQYPCAVIEIAFKKAYGKRYKTIIDLKDAYWQIILPPEYREKFAFSICQGPLRGHYEMNVLPQGYNNSMGIFQQELDKILAEFHDDGVGSYVDDVYIFSEEFDQHFDTVMKVLKKLNDHNMAVSPHKCQFFQEKVDLLGFTIGPEDISPQNKKLQALRDLRSPRSFKEVQSIMGSLNFYRKFLPNLSVVMKALSQCLKQEEFEWSENQEAAFSMSKELLSQELKLNLFNDDLDIILCCHFSTSTFACCLYQKDNDKLCIIGYSSSIQSKSQLNMVQLEKSFACALWAIQQFESYLHKPFVIQMLNNDLQKIKVLQNPSARIAMWQVQFQHYQFSVEQVSSKQMNSLKMFLALHPESHTDHQFKDADALEQQVMDKEKSIKQDKKSDNNEFESGKYDIMCQFDGACQKGKGSYAFAVFDTDKQLIHSDNGLIQGDTNNMAEYSSLLFLLQFLISEMQVRNKKILIQGDSMLIIKQVNGQFQCSSKQLQPLWNKCQKLIGKFSDISIKHIPREKNTFCDSLSKQALEIVDVNPEVQAKFTGFQYEIDNIYCNVCKSKDSEQELMLCDDCGKGFHVKCVGMPGPPQGNFYCSECETDIVYRNIRREAVDPTQNYELLACLQGQLSEVSNDIKYLASQYAYQNSKLYKKTPEGDRFVPTVGERDQLIKHMHYLAGHAGLKRTLKFIAEHFYWPKMGQQVKRILHNCIICQAESPAFFQPALHQPLQKPLRPFLIVHCDLYYMPKTDLSERAALIVVDSFTKWIESIVLENAQSATVWRAFEDNIIFRFGCPEFIISDNGPEFQDIFHQRLLQREIRHVYTSPLHPQANGQVERYVNLLKSALRKLFSEHNESKWTEMLQQACFALRILQTRSTGISSFEALYGVKPQLPGFLTKRLEQATMDSFNEQDIVDHVQYLQRKRHAAPTTQNLQKMEQEIFKVMTKRQPTDLSNLQFGDFILLRNYRQGPLDLKATGPGLFLQYNNQERNSLIAYNINTKRVHRCNITNVAPLRTC